MTCPNCKMRVLPKTDGTCPSCQAILLHKRKDPISKSIKPTQNSETSTYLKQKPSLVTNIKTATRVTDSRRVSHGSASTKLKRNNKGNSTVVLLGLLLIFAGFLLFVSAFFHYPSNFWNQGAGEVRWYKIDGVEVINNEILSKYSLIQPEEGDPTHEELTQLAIDWDPSFFTGSPINERINLGVLPGSKGYEFRIYLARKLYEKVDMGFYSRLAAYEVIPSPRPRNGFIVAIASVVFGLILIVRGREKALKGETNMPQNSVINRLFAIKCPDCGGAFSDKDVFCPHCGVNLDEPIAQDSQSIESLEPKRGVWLTVMLVLWFVVNAGLGFSYLGMALTANQSTSFWGPLRVIVWSAVNVASIVAIWKWKKWGAYGISISLILGMIVTLFNSGFSGAFLVSLVRLVVVTGILYLLLRNVWDQMD